MANGTMSYHRKSPNTGALRPSISNGKWDNVLFPGALPLASAGVGGFLGFQPSSYSKKTFYVEIFDETTIRYLIDKTFGPIIDDN